MKLLRLIPSDTEINFIKSKTIAFFLSIALIIASFGLLATKGLNFGIDFTGGIVIELRSNEPANLAKIRSALNNSDIGEISLQNLGTANDIMIRIGAGESSSDERKKVIDSVKTILAQNITGEIDYRKVDFVGPQVGSELIKNGILSLILAICAIMIYIWLRFEWQFGLGAIVALFHDVILTVGLFSLLGLEFNLTSIAAILTIIGYSINDSVVIYDRIRENLRKFKKKPLPDLLNLSINSTLSRTILTAGTTISALIALVVFGGDIIRGFSIAALFGVVIGTYSSIYIAAPILTFFDPRENNQSS